MYIRINKLKKRLQLINNESVVFDFPCVIGKNIGPKTKQGDLKTPELLFILLIFIVILVEKVTLIPLVHFSIVVLSIIPYLTLDRTMPL